MKIEINKFYHITTYTQTEKLWMIFSLKLIILKKDAYAF